MGSFVYVTPESLEEACTILSRYKKGEAMVIAGGTDLIVAMKEKAIQPQCLVGLERIDHLDRIQYSDREGLKIGPLVTLRSIETNTGIRERFPILSEAAQSIGSVQIRNLGTIGGNLCHAAPSADLAPPLLCLDAQATVTGVGSERWISLDQFFKGPNDTVLREGEILTEIRISPHNHFPHSVVFPCFAN